MIYTCTLNPSIDYLVEIEEVSLGKLNRAKKTAFYPGGKGINVSRVLKNLGVPNVALGYIGGFTGQFIQDFLERDGITQDFIPHDEPTRVNVKLRAEKETEINGQGAYISEELKQQLLDKISSLTQDDILVVAGSLPPSIPANFYETIAKFCQENNIRFVIDTGGQTLKDALKYKPFLIKPNHHELSDLLGVEIHSKEDVLQYADKLLDLGPTNILVTLGGEGAVLVSEETIAYANVPKGELKNSVGAGDSTVAGFLASFVEIGDLLHAFKTGVACGSATAFSEDLCTKSEMEILLPQIAVKTIVKE